MASLTVVPQESERVVNPHCMRCLKAAKAWEKGLPLKFDIDIYRLPQELLNEINQMPAEEKFDLVWGDHQSEKWQRLLEKHGVNLCECGAVL